MKKQLTLKDNQERKEELNEIGKRLDSVIKFKKEWNNEEDRHKSLSLLNKYERDRFLFVCLCVKYRMSYADISKMLNISKQYVYKIYRYGLTGQLTKIVRKRILARDQNICQICRKSPQKGKSLSIHHIGNPRSKSSNNLISLCISCHTKLDAVKRKTYRKLSTPKGLHS